MRLTDYLSPERILPELSATERDEILDEVARHLAESGVPVDPGTVRDALIAREETHTTIIGRGIALPHATVEDLDEPVLLVAAAPAPLGFGPEEEDRVQLFFVLLSPPDREGEHIKLLARICRLVRYMEDLDALLEPGTAEGIYARLEALDAAHV